MRAVSRCKSFASAGVEQRQATRLGRLSPHAYIYIFFFPREGLSSIAEGNSNLSHREKVVVSGVHEDFPNS